MYRDQLNELHKQIHDKNTKFIVVTGGVLSGLGKGVALASVGLLVDDTLKKFPIKCDGYLNFDPGTMNPIEHGEVFVLDDGTEVDMDFGHYERFLNISCHKDENITMGRIYKEIIDLERKGEFLGKTVKLIPEVSDYIEYKILKTTIDNNADIVLLEIGGTIGDIENELFIYAIKNIIQKQDGNIINIHITYIPELYKSEEQKTKPAQNALEELFRRGIKPDIIICRTHRYLNKQAKEKLSIVSQLDENHIISGIDTDNIYEIPIIFKQQNLDKIVCEKLNIQPNKNIQKYIDKINKINELNKNTGKLKIGICGKYTTLKDSYVSITEALTHASAVCNCPIDIEYIDAAQITSDQLKKLNGIIVPGGYGSRGVDGKINAIKYARENKIPFLGLCYGLQLAIVEYARNVCGLKDANTTEIDPNTPYPVIDILPNQKQKELGGTMRLGAYDIILKDGTKIMQIYNSQKISERHRHRYEVNPKYHSLLEKNGLIISGTSPDGALVEFIELKDHPFFIATQSHPELKSKLLYPHPLFIEFLTQIKSNFSSSK